MTRIGGPLWLAHGKALGGSGQRTRNNNYTANEVGFWILESEKCACTTFT
jgi:hypothetical protein